MISGVDLNLLWAAAAGLVVGAAIVFLLLRRGGSVNRERAESLASELEETRLELESHREEVAKHFGQTSDLFRDLTEQYSRLYAHLATGAREFCPDDVPSLGQGLDTPLLIDEAPVAERVAEESAATTAPQAEAPASEDASSEPARTDAAGGETQERPAGDAPVPGAAEGEKAGRLAVDAPVPGAAPPPVGAKASGSSQLTH